MYDLDNDYINRDLARLVCGKPLGRGQYREVFLHRQDSTLVVKTESRGQSFANIREWEHWKDLEGTHLAKWLAPCVDISLTGSVLLQRRVVPVISKKELPRNIPSLFLDTKIENWGMLDGRPVCCDYSHLDFNWKTEMKRAEWWTLSE